MSLRSFHGSPQLRAIKVQHRMKMCVAIIQQMADGKIAKEIAESLKISESTIEAYKRRMFEDYNVDNACELVAYAFRNNMIK